MSENKPPEGEPDQSGTDEYRQGDRAFARQREKERLEQEQRAEQERREQQQRVEQEKQQEAERQTAGEHEDEMTTSERRRAQQGGVPVDDGKSMIEKATTHEEEGDQHADTNQPGAANPNPNPNP